MANSGARRGTSVDVDVDGFAGGLRKALDALKIETVDDLVRVGLDVQNRARSLCPVDTGRLRSSISSRRGRDGDREYVEIGTNVKYAAFVELGTRTNRAQPFLRPALAEAARAFGRRG